MVNDVVIVDSEYSAEVMHLNSGIDEMREVLVEYKLILNELTKDGIVDKSIHNVMVEKSVVIEEAIIKLEAVLYRVFILTSTFIDSVNEKDIMK